MRKTSWHDPASRLQEDGLCIFLFHGVIPDDEKYRVRNYTGKHIPLSLFDEMMARLDQLGHALSMDEVLEIQRNNLPFPPESYAITFDDGFSNNLEYAAEVLDEYNIPATFYITTGFIDQNRMSWIDRIEELFELVHTGSVELPWEEESRAFSNEADQIQILNEIRTHVKNDPDIDIEKLIMILSRQLEEPAISNSDKVVDRKMNWEQVNALASNALFTIGGHTHSHAVMSFLSPQSLRREVNTSIRLMRENLNLEPIHYSYPEGLEHCFNDDVIAVLKNSGIRCCPTAIDGMNYPDTDPFHLRRIMIG
ncbi:polysaccharide deacetylase family protein [bacterium]|nr:polysaccharide deacetylase family protein [bacterium]